MSIFDWFRPRPVVASAITPPTTELVSAWAQDHNLERMTLADLYSDAARENLPVTRDFAMKVPAINKGHRIITSTIARCPLIVRDGTTTVDSPLATQLTENTPNSLVIAAILDALIFHGSAYLLVTGKTPSGWPERILFVPESQADHDDGMLTTAFGRPVKSGEWTRIDSLTDPLLTAGTSVIRDAADVRQAAAEAGVTPTPTVVLKPEDPAITQDEIDEMVTRWVAARRRKHGTAAAVSAGVSVEFAPQPSGEALQAGQNAAIVDCARLLGLPAWAVDGTVEGGSLTYSNSASRMRELVEFGLAPYITALEDGLSRLVPDPQMVKVDTAELVNSDRAARLADYKVGFEMGLYTLEDLRQFEGLPPLPPDTDPKTPPPDPTEQDPK